MKRAHIFENLDGDQQILWDVFAEAAISAGQTPKLTVRRSRRRPISQRKTQPPSGLFGVDRLDGNGPGWARLFDVDRPESPDAFLPSAEWQSPAQRGRRETQKQRGPHGNGPDWSRRTRTEQARINQHEARLAEAYATGDANKVLRAIYSNQKIETLAYDDNPLSRMLPR